MTDDDRQLPVPGGDPGDVPSRDILAELDAAADDALAPRTLREYRRAWGQWEDWAADEGITALPASPARVAQFLAHRSESVGSSALRIARAAIRWHHERDGLPDPTQHPGVKRVLQGLMRRTARPARQVDGLTAADMAAVRATACKPRIHASGAVEAEERAEKRGRLDIALCSTMRDAMLRRTEAAALTWGDIETADDGSGRLTIQTSKTDPEAEGATLWLSPATMAALNAIRPAGEDPGASVFGGLKADTIARRIRRIARHAELKGNYSGHSPRVGMAMDLAAAGTELPALMVAGRWESSRMPAHYARRQLAGRGAVARYYRSAP